MARFMRKAVEVEAEEYDPVNGYIPDGVVVVDGAAHIETLEGRMKVRPGAWIVTGVRGERYPVDPDIFPELYEAVVEGGT